MGKILRVDLTAGVCSKEALDPGVAKDYIGGRGLGIYYLNQEVDAGVDDLYQKLRGFWANEGYRLIVDEPVIGIMMTDLLMND